MEGGGLSDGDYGDVTVSGVGTVITIDNNAVSDAKLRDSVGDSVIGRSVNSTGDPADIVAGSDGNVLRRTAGVLGFGDIPESSVTNLVTDLADKVPTTRLINTTSPIQGGGNLSADRTISFDSSAVLDNNARVKVDKNNVAVGVRREIDFVEGSNITLTITDDNPNEKVHVTIAAAAAAVPTSNFTVTVPYVRQEYTVNIIDAGVGTSSKILVWRAATPLTSTNDFPVNWIVSAAKVGSFDFTIFGENNSFIGGPFDFHYITLT